MTKLRFYFNLCKDEKTLLRSDETGVTILLHSPNWGIWYKQETFYGWQEEKTPVICYLC